MARADGVILCRQIIAKHSKTFSLASRILDDATRNDVAIVYAYCRRCDDAVDDTTGDAQKEALARLRADLAAIESGSHLNDPVLAAFADVMNRRKIPIAYPKELIAGMAMDVDGTSYQTINDVYLYCHRAAGVVGLLLCHLLGVRDRRALAHAAHLGIAFQLTNICRDVAEDAQRGRRYLPSTLVEENGAGIAMKRLLAEADKFYRSADNGMKYLPLRVSFAIRAARLIYADIGTVIANRGHDPGRGRAVVPFARKLWLLAGALLLTFASLPARLSVRKHPVTHNLPLARYPHDILPI